MARKLRWWLAGLLILAVGYLMLAPISVEPVAWNSPRFAGYQGPHQVNLRLSQLKILSLQGEAGPEHVVVGPDGKVYASVQSGKIIRMQLDGGQFEVVADTGGRPLGFDFDAQGNLLVADAMRGLLLIGPDQKVTPLLTHVAPDDPILFADAVVVAENGKIYLSDATRRFAPGQWGGTLNASVVDLMEHSATGRVIEYDPASKKSRIVLRDLAFANGLALSVDQRSLFVVETGEYRVWKVDVQADNVSAKKPDANARILLSNLPGFPDNLTSGRQGRIWLGLTNPRGAAVDYLAAYPFLRQMTLRLPKAFWPIPPAYGHVFAFDEEGKVLLDLQDSGVKYSATTGATEYEQGVFIHSLHAPGLGWLPNLERAVKAN